MKLRNIVLALALASCASKPDIRNLVPTDYNERTEKCSINERIDSSGWRAYTEIACDRNNDGEFDRYQLIPPGFNEFHPECRTGEFYLEERLDPDEPCVLTDKEIARIQRDFKDLYVRRIIRVIGDEKTE